jgi:hypothetical protein
VEEVEGVRVLDSLGGGAFTPPPKSLERERTFVI